MTEEEKKRELEQAKKLADAQLFASVYLDERERRENAAAHPTIDIRDQKKLNENVEAIASGKAVVVDGLETTKELAANEVSANDQVALGANLAAIASGEKTVVHLSRR